MANDNDRDTLSLFFCDVAQSEQAISHKSPITRAIVCVDQQALLFNAGCGDNIFYFSAFRLRYMASPRAGTFSPALRTPLAALKMANDNDRDTLSLFFCFERQAGVVQPVAVW